MSYSFEDRVAIVTGAGGGLGYEYAKYLAAHGAKVIVNDLGGDPLGMDNAIDTSYAVVAAKKIQAAGGIAEPNQCSVSEYSSAKQIVEQAMDTWGRIDIIINNAGITSPAIFPDIEKSEMEQQHAVHVMGTVNTMRAAWPHMLKQQYGRIVNTSSSSALGFVSQIAYPTMKASILGLNNSLALLGKEHNIHINAIMPAAFTRMTSMLPDGVFRQRLEKDFSPDKLAPVIAYLCHEESQSTGEIYSVGGGRFYRIAFAASEPMEVDGSIDSVASQMGAALDDNAPLTVVHDAFDDLRNLGFSEEEYDMYRDMATTHNSHAANDIDAVKITEVDNVWNLTVKSPVGDQFSTLVVKSNGNTLEGNVLNDEHGAQKVLEGKIEEGDTLTWSSKLTKPVPMTLTYAMKMDERQHIVGTVKGTMLGKEVMNSGVTGVPADASAAQAAREKSDAVPEPKKGLLNKIFG